MAKFENLRFGVKLLDENEMSLYIRGEYGGESYGEYVRFSCGVGGRMEVPAETFAEAVSLLQQIMRQTESELQRKEMADEKKCAWYAEYEGVCTNADSQYCAEWCPISGELGMCRFDKENNDG